MFFNFRIDPDNPNFVLAQLRGARPELAQGWGEIPATEPDFVARTFEAYRSEGMRTTRIPSNLLKIQTLRDGDVLVTPHLPARNKVSLHVVSGDYPDCYRHATDCDNDLRHRIRIRESFGLDGNVSARNGELAHWYSKLQWLRLPIIPMPQYAAAFDRLLLDLRRCPNEEKRATPLQERMEKILDVIIQRFKTTIRDEFPNVGRHNEVASFESFCKRLIESGGYDFVRGNEYDGQGADADLCFTRARGESSDFETGVSMLYVQAKKHSGRTDKTAVEQLLAFLERDPSASGCVMSTADGFETQAVALAEQNDVLLLNGEDIGRLFLKHMLAE